MATRIKPTTLDDIPEKDNEMQQELESRNSAPYSPKISTCKMPLL